MDDFGTNNTTNYSDPLQQPGPITSQANNNDDASQKPVQVSTGGFSPEVVNAQNSQAEVQPKPESGYDKIKEIERAAETAPERQERTPQPVPQQPQPKPITKPVVKPETSPKPTIKYFGYAPPKKLLANPDLIKKQVGKGSSKDSHTWLVYLLNRLKEKESQ